MLHLVEQNKAGRNIVKPDGEKINWRALFKESEDSLTSSVFSLLLYLPVELLWKILHTACYDSVAPRVSGRLEDYEFWPRWESTEDNTNTSHVEPDLVLFFERFDVIIEAKRYDYNQQKPSQWREELIAYFHKFLDKGKDVYFLAVGGIYAGDEGVSYEPIPNSNRAVPVIRCRWRRILKEVKTAYEDLNKTQSRPSSDDALHNILQDLLLAFRIHGFFAGDTFETMPAHLRLTHTGTRLVSPQLRAPFRWKPIPDNLLNLQTPTPQLLYF